MITYLLFKIRYYLYIALSKAFEPKRHEYIMFFLGRYPQNFKHGFKAVLDTKSLFRYSIGSACIVIRFDTTKNIFEVQQTFNKVYDGYMDSFFIFDSKSKHAKTLDQVHYKHLYDNATEIKSPDMALNRIQEFVEVLQQMRYTFMKLIEEHQEMEKDNEVAVKSNEVITMEDIDPILEKIKDHGIDSLTDKEKLILKKYTKND
jgi:hypothetical protein